MLYHKQQYLFYPYSDIYRSHALRGNAPGDAPASEVLNRRAVKAAFPRGSVGTIKKRDGVCNPVAYVLCIGEYFKRIVGVANPDRLCCKGGFGTRPYAAIKWRLEKRRDIMSISIPNTLGYSHLEPSS